MNLLSGLIVVLYISVSLAFECKVTTRTLPYTDCFDETWKSVVLVLEPKTSGFEFPISEICSKKEPTTVSVNVTNSKWVQKGYLFLKQKDFGTHIKPATARLYIKSITVDCGKNLKSTFGIERAVETGRWYDFSNFDTNINHGTCNADQNIQEISVNRADYARTRAFENGPYVVKSLNLENLYELRKLMTESKKLKANIFVKSTAERMKTEMVSSPFFTSMEDYNDFLSRTGFPIPDVKDYWKEDSWFAAQRLQGALPFAIKNAKSVPKVFKIRKNRVESIMGERLWRVIKSQRLFIVKIDELAKLKYIAPMALFYVDKKNNLKPLAIQLQRDDTADQVFYPDDSEYSWLLAKMYFNLGESFYHQMNIHLGSTHIMLDAVGALMHQTLPPSHPVFKLMKPFFYQMFGNNLVGAQQLLKKGGHVEVAATAGRENAMLLLNITAENFDYKDFNPIINNLLRKTNRIKIYPYRDRALPIYVAIKGFVRDVLRNHYQKKGTRSDKRLREFRASLSRPQSCQGAGIKNLPGDGKTGAMNFHQLVDMVSTIIWQCSAGHSAIHRPQYHQFAYTLNYPMAMKLDLPKNKDMTEKDLVARLPYKAQVLTAIGLTYSFLFDGEGAFLGGFDRQYLYDPRDLQSMKKFNVMLDKIKEIKYKELEHPYTFLDLDTIRNSARV